MTDLAYLVLSFLLNYLLIRNQILKYRINNLENKINDLYNELDLKEQENRELKKGA